MKSGQTKSGKAFQLTLNQVECFDELRAYLLGLTTYAIYDKWIKRYGPATAMSIDYIGYHIYTICMILMESPLTTRTTLEPMMEKCKGSDMYKRIQAIIG